MEDIEKDLENIEEINDLDIILFKGDGIVSKLIEFFGESKYSHVGIVLKNPTYIDSSFKDGLYLFESSYNNIRDVEDNIIKIGVQLHYLEDILKGCPKNTVFIRNVSCNRDESFYKKLKQIHDETRNKPYDLNLFDWIVAKYNLEHTIPPNCLYKQTKEFWCSAFVSYVFYELGLIKDINWSIIAPRDFSSDEGGKLEFLCKLSKEKIIN
jgi:hypothetical protein